MRMKLFSVFTSVCLSILLMATFGCSTGADPVEVVPDVTQEEAVDTVTVEEAADTVTVEETVEGEDSTEVEDVRVEGEVAIYIMEPLQFKVAVASR